MLIIEIKSASLPLITLLNNGVTPKVEEPTSFFVFHEDEPAQIVPVWEAMDLVDEHNLQIEAFTFYR